ncbi:MAG: hypothetical protein PHN82_08655 [bacterium]|nr:hypothetical protein [bacterium]
MGRADGWTGRAGDARCLAVLALLAVALFRRALFGGAVVMSHPIFLDLTHQYYPWRLFGFGLLREGTIPLWNPYSFCGVPFLANWHSAIFYPPNAVFLFLPVHTALNWSIAAHFLLGGALTYAFARRLLGDRTAALLSAIAFMFSGPVIVQILPGHVSNPIPWTPLAFLLADRASAERRLRDAVLLGAVFALMLLAGHPQYAFYAIGAAVLYALGRAAPAGGRSLRPLAVAAALTAIALATAALLSAVQLLPGIEFARLSNRALLGGPETVGEVSLPPENIATLVAPGLFGDMQGSRYWGRWLLWETCLYVGILPLVLAAAGALLARDRRALLFAALAAASAVLALGAYSPLFPLLHRYAPGLSLFRGQAKFILITAFSLSVLAGFGCRLVTAPRAGEGRRLSRIAAVCLAAGLAVAALCILAEAGGGAGSPLWRGLVRFREARGFEGTPPLSPLEGEMFPAAYRVARSSAAAAAVLLLLSGGLLLAAARGAVRGGALALLVLAIALSDLWRFGAKYVIVSPLETCFWSPGLAGFLRADRSAFRICAPNIGVPGANQNMSARIHAIDGYETLNVGAYKEYVDRSQGIDPASRLAFRIDRVTPMLEALGLKYVLLPAGEPFGLAGYRRSYTDGRTAVYEKEDPAPRAYVAHAARVIPEKELLLAELRRSAAARPAEALLDRDPGAPLADGGDGGTSPAEIVAETAGEITVEAVLSRPGFLVLRDTYYPGWRAYAGGRELPVLRADHAFRAVCLPAGRSRVTLRYEPGSFRLGAWSSGIGLCLLAAYLCAARRRGGTFPGNAGGD